MKKYLFIILFILALRPDLYAWGQAQTPTPVPTISSWPSNLFSRISNDLSDDWIDQTSRLSVSLFDELANIELFSVSTDSLEVSPEIRRQVFDNRDLFESYTVADTFKLPLKISLWSDEDIPFPSASLGIGAGIEMYFQGLNIRQVKSKDFGLLEAPPQDLENRIRNLRRARYGKWWNALILPLRLPFTDKSIEKMQNGEISSWLLGGTLRLDGSFGWGDLGVLGADFIEINSGFTTYLAGTFKASALKLSSTKMRLKIARERKHGLSVGLGQSRMEYTLFEGFMVFGSNVLDIQESVIPFSFQTSFESARGFDVVYDYDLSKEESKRAYYLAAQGRLEESHKLSQIKDSGVEYIISRDSRTQRRLQNSKMKLSLIFQKQSVESWTLTQAEITTPDSKHTIYQSKNINVRGFDSLWGAREEKRYEVAASLDEDGSWVSKNNVLEISMNSKDSDMSGNELNSVITEVEELSGIDLKLPAFPVRVPCRRCTNKSTSLAWYGPVSALVKIDLPGSSLEDFLRVPTQEYWPLLETAYQVPIGQWSMKSDRFWWSVERLVLTIGNAPLILADMHMKSGGKLLSAWRTRRHWRLAAKNLENKSSKRLAKRLGKIFKQRHYNREVTKLVVMSTKLEDNVPTLVDVSAPESFGRIRQAVGEFPGDDLNRLIRRTIDFDIPSPSQDFDPDMNLSEASITRQEDQSLLIGFKLEKQAKYLHWHIEKKHSFGRRTTLFKRIKPYLDTGIEAGEFSFILQKDDSDPFHQTLYESLNQDFPIAIRVSASHDGHLWGVISELSLDPYKP